MRFEIRQSKRNRQWRAYLIGANNKKVWFTEQYHNLTDAEEAVSFINGDEIMYPVVTKYADGKIEGEY